MWYMSERGGADLPLANQEIKIGGSKAVVTLSSGEQLSLFGDTIVCVNDGLATLVNMKDTLNFMKSNHPVVADNSYNVIQISSGWGVYCAFGGWNNCLFEFGVRVENSGTFWERREVGLVDGGGVFQRETRGGAEVCCKNKQGGYSSVGYGVRGESLFGGR